MQKRWYCSSETTAHSLRPAEAADPGSGGITWIHLKGAGRLTLRINLQRIDDRVPEQTYRIHPYRLDVHTRKGVDHGFCR